VAQKANKLKRSNFLHGSQNADSFVMLEEPEQTLLEISIKTNLL